MSGDDNAILVDPNMPYLSKVNLKHIELPAFIQIKNLNKQSFQVFTSFFAPEPSEYKHDWKKVNAKIIRINKVGSNYLYLSFYAT